MPCSLFPPYICQENPEEDGEGSAEGDEAAEGEEEAEKASDPCLSDADMDDDRSQATQQMHINPSLCSAPTLHNGFAMAPPTAAPKKRAKGKKTLEDQIKEAEEDNDAHCSSEARDVDVSCSDDVPEFFKRDEVLSKVAVKLKKVYKCFWNLVPAHTLKIRKPAGHQLNGVRLSDFDCSDRARGQRLQCGCP